MTVIAVMQKGEPMAIAEIAVKVDVSEIENLIDQLKDLQTYKLYEGAEQKLVDLDKVVKIFADHVEAEVAQPEIMWIPCSEKMPRGQVEVIVSCHDDSGDTPFDYTSCGFATTDGEYWIVDNEINNHVVAWRELPEPWRGEEHETD